MPFLAIFALLYLTGLALLPRFVASSAIERHYLRIVAGALVNGWLAFTLSQLGIFHIVLHCTIVIALGIALRLLAKRTADRETGKTRDREDRRPADRENRRPGEPQTADRSKRTLPGILHYLWLSVDKLSGLLLVIVLVAFFALTARPFEVIIGVRDAGIYAGGGIAAARTGGIVQHDQIVAQIAADQLSQDPDLAAAAAQAETNILGVQNASRFIASRLRAAGLLIYQGDLDTGSFVPQGLHLFTAWVTLLTSIGGPAFGLYAPGLLGMLGVWSVAMLGRRLAGPWVGTIAAALLALNAAQIWFSRYSTTETAAQFLTFAGLYAFAAMRSSSPAFPAQLHAASVEPRRRVSAAPRGVRRSSGVNRSGVNPRARRQPMAFAALPIIAGLAIGQLALARIEFFLVVVPVLLFLLYTWLTRRWGHQIAVFAASFAAMLLHAAVQFATVGRAYVFDTLFARLQDYAITSLIALPFLTPNLRNIYLLRPCSRLTLQPCPPVAGMPPTIDAPWNVGRIAAEIAVVLLIIAALALLRRYGQGPLARVESLLRRFSRPLRLAVAIAILGTGLYAYLIRPQILTVATVAAIPGCLAPAALSAPAGPCLALQGYVGAPIAAPKYPDPLLFAVRSAGSLLRGRLPAATPAACAAVAPGSPQAAPAEAPQPPDYLRDEAYLPVACRDLRLRDLIANSQPNLVRVGWYTSPIAILLAIFGLALWCYRDLSARSWLFFASSIAATVMFVRLTYGTSDQHYIYILRRYVPQVFPLIALAAAYAIAALLGYVRPHARPARPARHLWLSARIGGPVPGSSALRYLRASSRIGGSLLLAAQLTFLIVTGLPIARHTEYAGALDQTAAIAARFAPTDIVVFRGGAPSYAQSRDIPDILTTPLTLIHGVNAFTIKSKDPTRYAPQLARYVQRWREQGRTVYLASGPSGALALPGYALVPAGTIGLDVPEFEQLTDQKPRNVQRFAVEFALYRLEPAVPAPLPSARPSVAPDSYGLEIRGLYRAETIAGAALAWTDGDALLRVPYAAAPPSQIAVRLAPGQRPAALGATNVCIAVRAETSFWTEDPAAPPFLGQRCFTLAPEPATYTIPIPPGVGQSVTGALLVHIASDTWIPARDDPAQRDRRQLGVQLLGIESIP